MKTKIIVGYSTNRDEAAFNKFNKEIRNTIGLSKASYDIHTIFNDGRYSLTEVYNRLWNEAIVEYPDNDFILVFVHHDIHFKTRNWGKTLLNLFNNNDVDIIGLAGTDELRSHCMWWGDHSGQFDKMNLWGKVWHTNGKTEWKSDFTTVNKKCAQLQPVSAIDGVFIAVNPDKCLKFDEEFSGFHFYDISFCIPNVLAGNKIAVTETIAIVHESGGNPDQAWEDSRLRLYSKYQASGTFPLVPWNTTFKE